MQRGTSCIGGAPRPGSRPAGGTSGLSDRVARDGGRHRKLFTVVAGTAGTAVAGEEGEYHVRAEFLASGARVTGIILARGDDDGQPPAGDLLGGRLAQRRQRGADRNDLDHRRGPAPAPPLNITTVDTTRTALFFGISGGNSGSTGRLDDVSLTGTINGSERRVGVEHQPSPGWATANIGTVAAAWFAVSFFRSATRRAAPPPTRCSAVAATRAAGTTATVNWSSVNPVIVVGGVTPVTATPTNGTTYTAGQTIGGFLVAYSGTLASDYERDPRAA